MPRTKRAASKKLSEILENIKPNKSQLDRAVVQSYTKCLGKEVELRLDKLDNELYQLRLGLSTKLVELYLDFQKDGNKTIVELHSEKVIEDEPTRNITANTTRGIQRTRLQVRSSSADRTGPSTVSKKSNRSRSSTRRTRNNFVTPASKPPPTFFGTVTPKVKPNAPQVLLRRPKQGELAISMQGSPLMVSGIATDSIPNINIPLQDGRMIAIQPQHGLRFSELPEFDPILIRNLEVLRDNLNQVCGRIA